MKLVKVTTSLKREGIDSDGRFQYLFSYEGKDYGFEVDGNRVQVYRYGKNLSIEMNYDYGWSANINSLFDYSLRNIQSNDEYRPDKIIRVLGLIITISLVNGTIDVNVA